MVLLDANANDRWANQQVSSQAVALHVGTAILLGSECCIAKVNQAPGILGRRQQDIGLLHVMVHQIMFVYCCKS